MGLAATAIGAAAAIVLVLSGKPGNDEESRVDQSFTPEEEVVALTIERAGATRSADDCDRLATPAFLEQVERLHGRRALVACQFGLGDRGLLDEPLTVTEVDGDPEEATAVVGYEAGSRKAGLVARIRVRDERLDRVEDYVDADRADMERAIRSELRSGGVFPVGAKAADCALERLRTMPDADLEALLLTGSSVAFYGPAVGCDRAGLIAEPVRGLRDRLPFLPASSLQCAEQRLRSLAEASLIRILADRLRRGAARIAFACGRGAVLAAYRAHLVGAPLEYPPAVADCVVARLATQPPAGLTKILLVNGTEEITHACERKGS